MFKNKKSAVSQQEQRSNIVKQAGVLNTLSGSKETMVARAGDIPVAQKLGILNMLRDEKNN